jgi:hypothetical protein
VIGLCTSPPRIRYAALGYRLQKFAVEAIRTGASVHASRFGVGVADADWTRIEAP